jgi:signal transduction histidine kinase
MNIDALVPEEERERARVFLRAIERGEEIASLEVTRKTKDGRVLDVWLTTTKLVDVEGRPVAVATTERDITERKYAERERERLLKELGDALQARDEFLSVASHELRNPLGALNLKLDLILKQARNAGEAGEKLAGGIEVALRQSGRLTRLIDELLDVSRITSGRLTLEREEVDLSQLIAEVEDRLRQMVERGGSSVELRVQPGVVGRWDRLRLEQVLVNLLTNAVKYGGRSSIEVSLRADERQATLAVRDGGPGISEAQQQHIFERFVRAAPRGVGGLGLGLYITRQIVEAHGGRLRVESQPGQGATFFVELPLRPDSEVVSG